MAVDAPNYTQMPNAILDSMHLMDNSEFRVVMAACRLTVGLHKNAESISISQFQKLTGRSRHGALGGIEKGVERGLLLAVGTGKRGVKLYRLDVVHWSPELHSDKPDWSTELTRTRRASTPTIERKENKQGRKD